MAINSVVANAKITGKNLSYLMTSSKCVIGRNSSSKVEVRVGDNACVSRQHLRISFRGNNLYMKCLGKNGVFINECFFVYSLEDVMMPMIFKIRFPSTDIVLQVESRGYLMDSFKKQYPLKKRMIIMPKESESWQMDVEENYLSESSGDNSSHTSRRLIPKIDGENDRLSPTEYGSESIKPPYSYAQLIIQAIVSTTNKQMTLSDIYRFISKTFPFYKMNHKGWQNSIRHNLSLNRYFIRVPRSQNNCTKSAYWRIDEPQREHLTKQAFWKRRSKNFCMYQNKGTEQKSDNRLEIKPEIDTHDHCSDPLRDAAEDNDSKHVFLQVLSTTNTQKFSHTVPFEHNCHEMETYDLGHTYDL